MLAVKTKYVYFAFGIFVISVTAYMCQDIGADKSDAVEENRHRRKGAINSKLGSDLPDKIGFNQNTQSGADTTNFEETIASTTLSEQHQMLKTFRAFHASNERKAARFVLDLSPGLKRNLLLRDLCNLIHESDHQWLIGELSKSEIKEDHGFVGLVLDPSNPVLTADEAVIISANIQDANIVGKGQLLSYAAVLYLKKNSLLKAIDKANDLSLSSQNITYLKKAVLLNAASENPGEVLDALKYLSSEFSNQNFSEGISRIGINCGPKYVSKVLSHAEEEKDYNIFSQYLGGWLLADSMDAGRWVNNLEEGSAKDYGRSEVVKYLLTKGDVITARDWNNDIRLNSLKNDKLKHK